MSDPSAPPAVVSTCFDCGYDLRGLPPDAAEARCPECGLGVAASAEAFGRMQEWGAVGPLRRATGWLLLGACVAVAALVLGVAAAFLADAADVDLFQSEWLLGSLSVVGTLSAAAAFAPASAALLRRSPPRGRLGRRVLGAAGWAVPLCMALIWLLIWAEEASSSVYGSEAFGALMTALPMALMGGILLFVPLFVGDTARRVRLWPQRPALARVLRTLAGFLWAAVIIMVPAMLTGLWETATGDDLIPRNARIGRSSVTDLLNVAASAGSILFALCVPAALLALAATNRRARRLEKSLGAGAAEKVGEERQLEAVPPQGVEVE